MLRLCIIFLYCILAGEAFVHSIKSIVKQPTTSLYAAAKYSDVVDAYQQTPPEIPAAQQSSALPYGKAPSLFEFAKSNDYGKWGSVDTTEAQQNIEKLKENSATFTAGLKQFFSDASQTYNDVSRDAAQTYNDISRTVTESKDGISGGFSGGDFSLDFSQWQSLYENLRIGEYGAWYAAALAVIFALSQRQAGREEAKTKFAKELEQAQSKAIEASEAATIASKSASLVKDLVKGGAGKKTASEEAMLDNAKLRKLELDYQATKSELERLVKENAELQSKLNSSKPPKADVKEVATTAPAETQAIPPDEEEDKRILEVIKEVQPEKKKVAAKKAKAKKASAKAAPKVETPVVNNVEVAAENPWAELKDSTLKRKTVKELTDYLSQRGVPVMDENGKKLTKAMLVSTIRSI